MRSASVLPREVASMDTDIFFEWAKHFLKKTELLISQYKRIVLSLDEFDAHLKYESLKTLCDARIIVISIPAHTFYALQPLDVGVSSS